MDSMKLIGQVIIVLYSLRGYFLVILFHHRANILFCSFVDTRALDLINSTRSRFLCLYSYIIAIGIVPRFIVKGTDKARWINLPRFSNYITTFSLENGGTIFEGKCRNVVGQACSASWQVEPSSFVSPFDDESRDDTNRDNVVRYDPLRY